jgi:hypothetical protein
MAIHTSAITYSRGIPKDYRNFYLVAQANNTIPAPMSKYLRGYNFYNRKFWNNSTSRWPWRP